MKKKKRLTLKKITAKYIFVHYCSMEMRQITSACGKGLKIEEHLI